MNNNDEHSKKPIQDNGILFDQDEEGGGQGGGFAGAGGEGEEGKGGVAGEIRFRYRDAASLEPREDMLPESEIRRLLIVHRDLHKDRVDKQKNLRKERAALKEGKLNIQNMNRQAMGMGGGGMSKYKRHPISNKAQFSGIDRQTIGIPTEFDAETNMEMRDKLENRLQLRNAPKFNPKPRPF